MTRLDLDPRIRFFDDQAPDWDEQAPALEAVIDRLESLTDHLALQPGTNLLEVGCGTGRLTPWLARQVAPGSVLSIDFSPQMLVRARERQPEAEFRQADVCADHLGRRRFDIAFCMHAWPHFRDQPAAAANLARALKEQGRLIILHLNHWQAINHFHDHIGGSVAGDHLPAPDQWPSLLQPADLEIEHLIDQPDLFLLTARRTTTST